MHRLKADFLVIGCVVIVSALFFYIPRLLHREIPGKVVVMQDGAMIGSYSLLEDKTVTFSCEEGYNLMLIEDGSVQITDADCPDKLCVKQRQISRNGESIICLPHKMIITIESEEESDLDAVTN